MKEEDEDRSIYSYHHQHIHAITSSYDRGSLNAQEEPPHIIDMSKVESAAEFHYLLSHCYFFLFFIELNE